MKRDAVIKHLKGDIKGFRHEIKEDKELINKLGGSKMKRQGYNDRLDESLGMRHRGPHKQSLKDRRDESKGMEKARGKRAYSAVATMDLAHHHLKEALKHLKKHTK